MKKLWPIIERELRSLARSKQTVVTRFAIGFVGIALTLFVALIDQYDRSPKSNLGAVMIGFQTFFMLVFSVFSCLALTTDTISSEKREGTLGLLFLTDLKTIHIILGKISAGTFVAFLSIISMIPVMSLSLLYGGVSYRMILLLFLIAINQLVLSLVIGVFCSVLFEKPRTTQAASLLMILGVQFGVPILVSWASSGNSNWAWAMNAFVQAGALGAGGIFPGGQVFNQSFFWGGQITTISLALILFLISVRHLSSRWRSIYGSNPVADRSLIKKSRVRKNETGQKVSHANPQKKLKIKGTRGGVPLTHLHPLRYIFSHKKFEVGSTIFTTLIFALYMTLLATTGGFDESEAGVFGMVLCGMIFKYQWSSVVVSMFNRERKEGTLEFLMSTPVKLGNIFSDMRHAGLHDLKGTISICAIWQAVNLLIVLGNHELQGPRSLWIIFFGIIVFWFLDFEAILHAGAWLGLTNTNYSQGFIKTFIWIVCLPTWLFWAAVTSCAIVISIFRLNPGNDLMEFMPLLWAIFAAVWSVCAIRLSRNWMHKYLRIIASLPLNHKISFKSLNQIEGQVSSSSRGR